VFAEWAIKGGIDGNTRRQKDAAAPTGKFHDRQNLNSQFNPKCKGQSCIPAPLYNETHQTRSNEPTAHESLLGDSIERAYAQGIHDLEALVNYLNQAGPPAPNGEPWTGETLQERNGPPGRLIRHRNGETLMNTSVINMPSNPVEQVLANGLQNYWFPLCPSSFVKEKPVSLRRLGKKIAVWRDQSGVVHALEDHCPHRGAPLSLGVILGDRLGCPYHGVEVRCDGTTTRVPGSPGCKLEGSRATLGFHVEESNGAIFLYNSDVNIDTPPPLNLPEQLTSPEWNSFLCYVEWGCDYRYVIENVMDPMHGAYLHKQSHTMSEGDISAEFQIARHRYRLHLREEGPARRQLRLV
jgi:nitrite reductase/ring-hydroxylating ferredoxin subunit